jgi:uncharacterized protein involved in type VI secretion and phage assembly
MSLIKDNITVDSNKVSGVVVGLVVDNKDPDNLGRVKLKFSYLNKTRQAAWARVATLMAGDGMGTYFIPEVGDEVLIAFDQGDVRQPYVIGSLWNAKNPPPSSNQTGTNDKRLIKSRSGHQILLDDEKGKETIEVHSKSGHQIVLDDSLGKEQITVKDKSGNSIVLDSTANDITIKSQGTLRISASSIQLSASGTLEIKAGASLTLQGAVVKIN